jgi:biotin transport system substrate-specific component
MTDTTRQLPIASVLWPTQYGGAALRAVILAVCGTLLLTLSAKINVPFYPVPITMQTFAVLVIAMSFGKRLGLATVLLYLAEGAAGLPVFAGTPEKGIGLAYMAGPTAGYLLGFVLATLLVAYLAERGWDRNVITTMFAMTFGTILIFAPGILWLGVLYGWDKPILAWGLTPFLLGALFKIALAALLMPLAWKGMKGKF